VVSKNLKKYVPEINALRAVAIILVLLFHAYPLSVPGGLIGVDIFFVISGYVISRAYLFKLLRRDSTLTDFYLARFRRLTPALFVSVGMTAVVATVVMFPDNLLRFAASLFAQPLYLQNFIYWNQGSYFEVALTKPLLHTWSLGVEEQFYISFAALILIGWWRRWLLWPIFIGLFIGSILYGFLIASISPKTAFFLLPARIWEIGLGILAYLLVSRLRVQDRTALKLLALAAIVVAFLAAFVFGENTLFPGMQSFIATGATALALILFETQKRHFKILNAWPVTYVGLISYPLYLWHWPVISLTSIQLSRSLTYTEASAALGLSFVLASLTYRFVETPVRKGSFFSSRTALVAGCSTGFALMLVMASFLIWTNGAIFYYPKNLQPFFLAAQERSPYRCGKVFRILNPALEMCPVNAVNGKPGILILGDSLADQLDEMLGVMGQSNDTPIMLTVRNCDLGLFGKTGFCSRDVLDAVIAEAKRNNINQVLAISLWDDKKINLESFERDLVEFTQSGMKVWIMETVPNDKSYDPIIRAKEALGGGELSLAGISRSQYHEIIKRQRLLFNTMALKFPTSVSVLSPENALCPGTECEYHTEGYPNYFDAEHVTGTGAFRLRPIFEALFENADN
jgi:peptidoglycan/LPS O-acetylase OafA/YrhL